MKISVIGLGYVGLPIALEFAKHYRTIGFDNNINKIDLLKKGIDKNNEFKKNILLKSKLKFTYNIDDIKDSNVFIIALPSPIFKNKKPDLSLIKNASKLIGKVLKKNDLVIY